MASDAFKTMTPGWLSGNFLEQSSKKFPSLLPKKSKELRRSTFFSKLLNHSY